ncbi:MAG: hypothetical protein LBC47_08825 [Tannerella sp.]|jgi:hypothetical protein|nr:hypothetical protein [Tannerella sp.]
MKKAIVLFLLMGTFCCAGMAQDKIVTVDGDTVLCRILDVSAEKISYERRLNDGRTVGRFISSDRVSEYFRESQLLPERERTSRESRRSFFSLPSRPFRLGIEGGYGHMLSSFSDIRNSMSYVSSETADQYFSDMKNGIHLGADFHLLLNEYFGIGAKYSFFSSEAELNEQIPMPSSVSLYYTLSQKENFYFNYVAPSLFFRQWLDKDRRFALNETLSPGCLFFREELRSDVYSANPNVLVESRQFAGSLDVSLEYYLSPYLSVSANAGAFYAKIKKTKVSYVDANNEVQTQSSENDKPIDMSRLNLSAGLHVYF